MNVWLERAAVEAARRLPDRVRYWAAVHIMGAYIDAFSPTAGNRATMTDILSWADSPDAKLGGKGHVMTFLGIANAQQAEIRSLKRQIAELESDLAKKKNPKKH